MLIPVDNGALVTVVLDEQLEDGVLAKGVVRANVLPQVGVEAASVRVDDIVNLVVGKSAENFDHNSAAVVLNEALSPTFLELLKQSKTEEELWLRILYDEPTLIAR